MLKRLNLQTKLTGKNIRNMNQLNMSQGRTGALRLQGGLKQ